MKYIKINIKSAYLPVPNMSPTTFKTKTPHLIINNKREKGDKTVTKVADINSENARYFVIDTKGDNSLTVDKVFALHPIVNMLHCLFGYRPVSENRYSCYQQVPRMREIAENGFFKPSFDLDKMTREGIQASVAEFNSNRKITYIDWNYFKLFLRKKHKNASKGKKFSTIPFDELFEFISNKIAQLAGYNSYGDVSIKTALETIGTNSELIQQFNNIFSELEITDIKALTTLLYSDGLRTFNQYNFGSALLNNMKVLNVISINGSFYFPVSNEDIKQLSKGKLCCTYLDGGLAEIELDEYNNIKTFNNINENYFKATNCVTLKTLRK